MLHPERQSSALLCAVVSRPASGWPLLLSFTLAGARLSCKTDIKALRPPVLQSLPAKAHSATCSFESPRVSSFCDLLLCLASAEASLHTPLPSRSLRWLQGCELAISPACDISSLDCQDLSLECQILLVVCV